MDADELPTVAELLDAAIRFRDELDDETIEGRDQSVSWPWLPLLNIYDFATRLGMVRASELPEQPISREGARRKLDALIPILRARLPEAVVPPAPTVSTPVPPSSSVADPASAICPVRVVSTPDGRVLEVLTAANEWRVVEGLTRGMADAVAALVEGFPAGLTAEQLDEAAAASGARLLRSACSRSVELAAVVELPGASRRGDGGRPNLGRYRLRAA